jgi:hypothetical protein
MHNSDGFAAPSKEEYNNHAGEGHIDIDGFNGDGQSVSSSSNIGESFKVFSIADLDPELQVIKGSPMEILFHPV